MLSYFSCKLNQVEDLMEKALGGSYAGFPSDTDIDGKVYLPCYSRSFNIDDSDRIYFLFDLQVIHNSDKIFRFSRLAYHHDRLVLSDIVLVELGGINNMKLFEALEKFEEGLTCIACIIARAAGDHSQVGPE